MIPIFWTQYTAFAEGQVLKFVPCEHCSTEYVYVLTRESSSSDFSPYSLNDKSVQKEVVSNAEEAVQGYLATDFDAVPCPVCGHYQKYMFRKLMVTQSLWDLFAPAALLIACGLSFVMIPLRTLDYLDRPNAQALWRLGWSCAAFVITSLIGAALWAVRRARVRNFDPNTEDQQVRIARGRSRAVTRTEFEGGQHPTK